MGKGNGGTRSSGTSTGGVVPAPVDEYAAWRAVESTEKYTYDRDKMRFEVRDGINDVSSSDMRRKNASAEDTCRSAHTR